VFVVFLLSREGRLMFLGEIVNRVAQRG
jgi:hypothetical protein